MARRLILFGIPALLAIIAIAIGLSWANGIDNDGVGRQRQLLTVNNHMEIELSNCLDTTMVAAGIAEQERASVMQILVGTASARYGDGVQPGDSTVTLTAIREAYPGISDELYRQLMSVAIGCRNQTAGAQQKVQALGGEFDTWTQQGGVIEKALGLRTKFPDERLVATGPGGTKLTGREALDHFITPITTKETKQAAEDREMPQQTFGPKDGTPTPR